MTDFNEDGNLDYYKAAEGKSSLSNSVWHINNNKRHAFRVWSDFDPQGENYISPEQPEPTSLVVDKFSNLDHVAFRTKIVNDGDGSESIELDLDDRIITLMLDQSGSMTWNDNPNLRYSISRRMVLKNASTYPGGIKYNLVKFGGTPVTVNMFGVIGSSKVNSDDPNAALASFFEEDESRFAGVRIVRNKDRYPTSPLDGDIVDEGFMTKVLDDGLEEGETYFYTIFTFDINGHFSKGVNIEATPRENIIPRGVSSVETRTYLGTGVIRDPDVMGLWHFGEEQNDRLFDFSDSGSNLVFTDNPYWIGKTDVPIGSAGVRFNGSIGASTEETTSSAAMTDKLTLMAWVYPFDVASNRCLIARQDSSDANYIFSINSSAGLTFSNGSSIVSSPDNILTAKKWYHVAVTVDLELNTVKFYINGLLVGLGSFSSSSTVSNSMFIDIGRDRRSSINNFFGKLTEVSIHNTVRSSEYINEHATIPISGDGALEAREDNGDRLVVIRYEIPIDFDFPGGSVRIVRNQDHIPTWENDGDTISSINATAGEFYVTNPDDFVLGANYYYRIFTQNSIGNISFLSDSFSLKIGIEEFQGEEAPSLADDLFPSLEPVSNVKIRPGDNKLYLTWKNNLSEDRFARVDIYHSNSKYPVITHSTRASGNLVFSGTMSDEYFVHTDDPKVTGSIEDRTVINGVSSFYSIVVRDKYGRVSNPVNISGVPDADADEIGIPLFSVKAPSYEIFDNTSVVISWENPINLKPNISAWLDEKVILYASLTDGFGRPISDDAHVEMSVEANVISSNIDDAVVVFGDSSNTDLDQGRLFKFGYSFEKGGIVRGSLSMIDDIDVLSLIESVQFTVRVISFIPDPVNESKNLFEYKSSPMTVSLRSPLSLKTHNRDNRTVELFPPCREAKTGLASDCGVCIQSGSMTDIKLSGDAEGLFDGGKKNNKNERKAGTYATASNQFYIRTEVSYKDEPIEAGRILNVSVWDVSGARCSDEFVRIRESSKVTTPSSRVAVVRELIEGRKPNGLPSGEMITKSFADIPLSIPSSPQEAVLFVRIEYGNFRGYVDFTVVFENPLKIEIEGDAPEVGGSDIAEQLSSAWLIDPDNPDDVVSLPDGSLVQWSLKKVMFGEDHPFYSTENVPNVTGGVFSQIQSGVARNVFFGPVLFVPLNICKCEGNIFEYGESYELTATVIHGDLAATATYPLELYPTTINLVRKRFLMETVNRGENQNNDPLNYISEVWADGEDFVKIRIFKDAKAENNRSGSLSRFAECFVNCSKEVGRDIVPMPPGAIAKILAPGMEILWGDITEVVDPYTGEVVLYAGDDAKIKTDNANVEIEDEDFTTVYFRINDFRPPSKACDEEDEPGLSDSLQSLKSISEADACNTCLNTSTAEGRDDEVIISGSITLLVDGEQKVYFGGGDKRKGVPPTIAKPIEPLQIDFVQNLVDGVPSETFVFDGKTINGIVFDVSFAGKPVPDGTPITLDWESVLDNGSSDLELESHTIYTETSIRNEVDPENARSYAIANVKPITAEGNITDTLIATTTYDKTGTVERSINACVSVSSRQPDGTTEIRSAFSADFFAYDVNNDEWTQLANSNLAVAYSAFHMVNEKGYMIGGMGKTFISRSVDEYDPASDVWNIRGSMPTSRFATQSVVVNDKIYVLGGISEVDSIGGIRSLIVSRAVEVYDPSTDRWEILEPMPSVDDGSLKSVPYGVAFGSAVHATVGGSERIYIFSGIRKISDSGKIEEFNDRILYYEISSDSWTALDKITDEDDSELYKRASANFIMDGNLVISCGGISIEGDTDQSITLMRSCYQFDITSNTFSEGDHVFSEIADPFYRGGATSVGSFYYYIGGSNDCTNTLNNVTKIDSSVSPYGYDEVKAMPVGRSGFGVDAATVSSSPFSGNPHIFVAGGFVSGRPVGFLTINNSFSPSNVRLDGRQSGTVQVHLLDEACNPPEYSVKVIAKGFLKFEDPSSGGSSSTNAQSNESQEASRDSLDDRLAIYPVLFENDEISTDSEGKAIFTLLPRSDDILEEGDKILERLGIDPKDVAGSVELNSESLSDRGILIETGKIRKPYSIEVSLTVVDDLGKYFGQTVSEFNRSIRLNNEDNDSEDGDASENESECRCFESTSVEGSLKFKSSSGGISSVSNIKAFSDQNTAFNTVPDIAKQASSPIVPYFIDIDWMPTVDFVLNDNNSTAEDTLAEIRKAENSIPFGASALFDAIVDCSNILANNDIDSIDKLIYVFTDNESNMSFSDLDTAIQEVQSIDGFQQVPIVVGNLAVVFPITLSARANTTDTKDLETLTTSTGGQAVTILSESFEDDYVGIFSGEAFGSLGYGTFEFIVDLGETMSLYEMLTEFNLLDNTAGKWRIEVSSDLITWVNVENIFSANDGADLKSIIARYIRVTIVITTGFSASNKPEYEGIPLAESPSFEQLKIIFDPSNIDDIFVNVENPDSSVQQIAVAVNTSKNSNPSDIEIGATNSNSHTWSDFNNPSKPSVRQNSRIFVPIRYSDRDDLEHEYLEKVDKFSFKARYGYWDPESVVEIFDADGKLVSSDTYRLYPRTGIVVFDRRRVGLYKIKIQRGNKFRVGLRLTSRSSEDPIKIFGLGYLYNTNINLLPPVVKLPPEAKDVAISPIEPRKYSMIEANYTFSDSNDDIEDVESRRIRWFINGVRISYLDDLVKWNDVNDPNDPIYLKSFTFSQDMVPGDKTVEEFAELRDESILKDGDKVYFTIEVSDGNLDSKKVKSDSVKIVASDPVLSGLQIVGRSPTGQISKTIRSEDDAVLKFGLADKKESNKSKVKWFVNGALYKEGTLGSTEDIGVVKSDERDNGGNRILTMNNEITVDVIPQTANSTGESVSSDPIVVQNTLPSVSDVFVGPSSPKTANDLVLTFTFKDIDVENGDNTQDNLTTVKWFYSDASTANKFVERPEFSDESIVSANSTSIGQTWKAVVTPFDGLDAGRPVESNIVRIR